MPIVKNHGKEAAAEVRKAMVIGETKRETSPMMVYRQVSE